MSDGSSSGTMTKSPARESSYKVYRQGFLLKCTPRSVRKRLHRYWFVLFKQKDMLAFLYFQDEDHYLDRKKNEGFFRIDDCTSIDVIPEHMGRKNAFCIDTPRSKYFLVSESRYELHHWLLALHGAMDDYKTCTGRSKKKSNKQRSQSTTSPPVMSPHSSLTRTRIKPSRPAPPAPPKDKKKGNEENMPPQLTIEPQKQELEESQEVSSPTNKLDDIVAGLLQQSNEHKALEYTLTEDEDVSHINGDNREETGSLSTSLPMLNDKDVINGREGSNSDDEALALHTRHLSFSGSYEFKKNGGKKKRRPGSMKGRRSISPPNLPPPPPPPTDQEGPQMEFNGEHVINSFEQVQKPTKSSPKPPPPRRTTSLSAQQQKPQDMDVSKYLDEAFNKEDYEIETVSENSDKSPGILRKGDQCKSHKTVVFDETVKGRYEPRVDHETLPSTVARAKAKLFGGYEVDSFRYNRSQLQGYSNVEPQDDLLDAIETALHQTSYMEDGNHSKGVAFSVEVGPPNVPPPARPDHTTLDQGTAYSLETSPNEMNTHIESSPTRSLPHIDDTPTTSTFTADHETMYRSIV